MIATLHHLAGMAVALAGLIVVFVLVCRLNPLHASTHRESVLLMNQALGIACALAAAEAAQGHVSLSGAAVVVGTAAWLWVSYATWAGGPPDWTARAHGGRWLGLRWAWAAICAMRRR